MATPREILAANRAEALKLVDVIGRARARAVLEAAERELVVRLGLVRPGPGTFTYEQMKSALMQVRHVLVNVRGGMTEALVDVAGTAAEKATEGTVDYLGRLDRSFRGLGTQPLALNEAAMFEQARVGARSSILRRLASSGTGAPGAPAGQHPAKLGILDRYGMNVVGDFEQQLQVGLLTRKPWADVRTDIVSKSPFLQQKPGFWAERIVRTELMGAYNRAGWEANREADDQLGDMVKILSATFDDRTGSDSFAVHGQVRLPDEAFESWFGLYQHPPNRPNDREIVVPHRISWPIPKYLRPKTDAEVSARWVKEKRKGAPPPRPQITTVAFSRFGRERPPSAYEERPEREPIPAEGP